MNERRAEAIEKTGGLLTKRIAPGNGKIANNSSACRMAYGSAHRVIIELDNLEALAAIHAMVEQEATT